MNENIQRLVRLQVIANEAKDLYERRERIPALLTALDAAFAERKAEIGAARLRHENLSEEGTRLARERAELQQRRDQGQQKLMQVNNTREYSAVLNEIDANKGKLALIEDRIKEIEAEKDGLASAAAEADVHIAEELDKVERAKATLNAEARELVGKLADLEHARSEVASLLPSDFRNRFENVFKVRAGVAMSRVEKDACGACHVRLRPQVINQVKRGEDLIFCDNCRRILYIPDRETPADGVTGQGLSPAGA